ncbi:hypothetical protein DXG01_011736 [Tephrocybe rancida]|nr:hypothetical protein DXG01_011736 [Tephrocybe rancida]
MDLITEHSLTYTDDLPYGSTNYPPVSELAEYRWKDARQPPEDVPDQVLPPTITAAARQDFYYPLSPAWRFVRSSTHKYGGYYAADCSTSSFSLTTEENNLKRIINPPNLRPSWNGKRLIAPPIEGMVRMEPGIPYAFHVDGDPKKLITVGVLQTTKSITAVEPKVAELIHRLYETTFGRLATEDSPAISPIYTLADLKRNDRSDRKSKLASEEYNGSYSLGSTIEKGNGQGIIVPTTQADHAEAKKRISELLMILHDLYRLIAPQMLSKEELELADFHSNDNNVFSIGGISPCGTSVQMNVSSTTGADDLSENLGDQGRFHGDFGDEYTRMTLFNMLTRLPIGADPGPFMLGRPGLYAREEDSPVSFLSFRGNDPHSGTSPTVHPGHFEADPEYQAHTNAINACWPNAGFVNRVGFVVYHSARATRRDTAIAVSPETRFGNHGVPVSKMKVVRNFQQHGAHLLGSPKDAAIRQLREVLFGLANSTHVNGARLHIPLMQLAATLQPFDPTIGSLTASEILPFDALDPVIFEEIQKLRAHYGVYSKHCHSIALALRKQDFLKRKELHRVLILPSSIQPATLLLKEHLFQASSSAESPESPPPSRVEKEAAASGGVLVARITRNRSQQEQPRSTSTLAKRKDGPSPSPPPQPPKRTRLSSRFLASKNSGKHDNNLVVHDEDEPESEEEVFRAWDPVTNLQNGMEEIDDSRDELAVEKLLNLAFTDAKELEHDSTCDQDGGGGPISVSNEGDINESDNGKMSGIEEADNDKSSSCGSSEYSSEEDNEKDYEVESILSHRYNNENWDFLVKFKGYGKNKAVWYARGDYHLDGCMEIIEEYLAGRSLVDSRSSQPASIPDEQLHLANHLGKSLSLDQILREEDQLISALRSDPKRESRVHKPADSLKKTLAFIKDMNAEQEKLREYRYEISENTSDREKLATSIDKSFSRAIGAIKLLPHLASTGVDIDLLSMGFQWQQCRVLVTLQDFAFNVLPQATETMFYLLRHAPVDLKKLYPNYSGLVTQIFARVDEKRSESKREDNKKNRRNASSDSQPVQENTPSQQPFIPKNLFKPYEGSTAHILLKIPAIKTVEMAYEKSQKIFMNLVLEHLLGPQARDVHSPGETFTTLQLVKRCLLRGLILQCIVDQFGSESVFVTSATQKVIKDPILCFPNQRQDVSTFIDGLLDDPEARHMWHLRAWLKKAITPDICNATSRLFNIVLSHYDASISTGRPDLHTLGMPGALQPSSTHHTGKTRRGPGTTIQFSEVDILVGGKEPDYRVLAMMLQETLNHRLGKRTISDKLHLFLTNPKQADGDADYSDPIRATNLGAGLFKQKLPGWKLTQPEGLSNLLGYMGTGQGNKTRSFLALSDPEASTNSDDTFFKSSLAQVIEMFRSGRRTNELILLAIGSNGDPDTANPPDSATTQSWIRTSNCRIYGKPTNALKLAPTRVRSKSKLTLSEKFGPNWDGMPTQWNDYLGPMKGVDPTTFIGTKKDWKETMKFISGLGIMGLQTGLTLFQTVNNLVLSGICCQPTLDELAEWIWAHCDLGAFRGLERISFTLFNLDAVRVALRLVYNHLDTHMPQILKDLLKWDIFSVLAVEHLLCKDIRWDALVQTVLKSMGESSDEFPLPIPARQSLSLVKQVLMDMSLLGKY